MQKIRVTSEDFKGLVNPYTGAPMTVFMLVSSGPVKFFCPDTYSTASKFNSSKEAYKAWARENGVEDVRVGKPITCAYTGTPLRVMSDGYGLWWYDGGFDPRIPRSRQEFLHLAWMRDGKSPYPAEEPLKVEPVAEATGSEFRKTKTIETTDASMELAEKIVEKPGLGLQHKTVVNGRGKKAAK